MKIGTFVYLESDYDDSLVVLQYVKNIRTGIEGIFKVIMSENNDEYNVGTNVTLYSHEYFEVTNKYDLEKYNKIAIFQ